MYFQSGSEIAPYTVLIQSQKKKKKKKSPPPNPTELKAFLTAPLDCYGRKKTSRVGAGLFAPLRDLVAWGGIEPPTRGYSRLEGLPLQPLDVLDQDEDANPDPSLRVIGLSLGLG